jgi:hypothetical protein
MADASYSWFLLPSCVLNEKRKRERKKEAKRKLMIFRFANLLLSLSPIIYRRQASSIWQYLERARFSPTVNYYPFAKCHQVESAYIFPHTVRTLFLKGSDGRVSHHLQSVQTHFKSILYYRLFRDHVWSRLSSCSCCVVLYIGSCNARDHRAFYGCWHQESIHRICSHKRAKYSIAIFSVRSLNGLMLTMVLYLLG